MPSGAAAAARVMSGDPVWASGLPARSHRRPAGCAHGHRRWRGATVRRGLPVRARVRAEHRASVPGGRRPCPAAEPAGRARRPALAGFGRSLPSPCTARGPGRTRPVSGQASRSSRPAGPKSDAASPSRRIMNRPRRTAALRRKRQTPRSRTGTATACVTLLSPRHLPLRVSRQGAALRAPAANAVRPHRASHGRQARHRIAGDGPHLPAEGRATEHGAGQQRSPPPMCRVAQEARTNRSFTAATKLRQGRAGARPGPDPPGAPLARRRAADSKPPARLPPHPAPRHRQFGRAGRVADGRAVLSR